MTGYIIQLFKFEYKDYKTGSSVYAHCFYTRQQAEEFVRLWNKESRNSSVRIVFQYTKSEATEWIKGEIKKASLNKTQWFQRYIDNLTSQFKLAY